MLASSACELWMKSPCPYLSAESSVTSDSEDLASLTCVTAKDRAWGCGGGEIMGGKPNDRIFRHLPLEFYLLGNRSSQLF